MACNTPCGIVRHSTLWVKPVLVGQFEFTEWTPEGAFEPYSCFCCARSAACRVLVDVLYTVLVDEKVRLCFACDSDDVFIVVLDPASNFLATNELYNHWCPVFREAVDVLRLAESRLWRALSPISPADVFLVCSHCHVPQY